MPECASTGCRRERFAFFSQSALYDGCVVFFFVHVLRLRGVRHFDSGRHFFGPATPLLCARCSFNTRRNSALLRPIPEVQSATHSSARVGSVDAVRVYVRRSLTELPVCPIYKVWTFQ